MTTRPARESTNCATSRTTSRTTPKIPPDWFVRSRLKMRHLRLLVSLDEQRNMHRAAASLAMTQPAATRLLGELERVLGVQLFTRSARGIVPNAYGESIIRHARIILATLGHARDELNELAEGALGKVAVGVLLVAASILVPRAVARFKQRHPQITVLIRDDNAASLIAALRRGELDIVVGRMESVEATEGLAFEAFYREPMRLVVRAGHPLAAGINGKRDIKLASLADRFWLIPTADSAYRVQLDTAFRQAGVEPPQRIVESRSVATNQTLLRETDMLGVVPDSLARQYADLGILRVLPVRLPAPSGPVGAITVIGRPLPPGTSDLLDELRKAAQPRHGAGRSRVLR